MYSDGMNVGAYGRLPGFMAAAVSGAAAYSFYPSVPPEMNGMVDVAVDRALLASRNHREAEKRRRERIKSHLDRLRLLLACDPKIDKASLLAKAVDQVRHLKQQTSQIPNIADFPTETDEISVHLAGEIATSTGSRRSILKVLFCCDDRPPLLPELIDALKSLRLRTLQAEIATVGGRVRGALVVVREAEEEDEEEEVVVEEEREVGLVREALMAVVVPPPGDCSERMKRRKVLECDSAA